MGCAAAGGRGRQGSGRARGRGLAAPMRGPDRSDGCVERSVAAGYGAGWWDRGTVLVCLATAIVLGATSMSDCGRSGVSSGIGSRNSPGGRRATAQRGPLEASWRVGSDLVPTPPRCCSLPLRSSARRRGRRATSLGHGERRLGEFRERIEACWGKYVSADSLTSRCSRIKPWRSLIHRRNRPSAGHWPSWTRQPCAGSRKPGHRSGPGSGSCSPAGRTGFRGCAWPGNC